jgi:hypothetical protein
VTEVQKDVRVPRTMDAVTLFPLNLIPQFCDVCFFSYDYRRGTLTRVTTPAESSRIRQIKLRHGPWPFCIMVCYMFYKFPAIMFDQIT